MRASFLVCLCTIFLKNPLDLIRRINGPRDLIFPKSPTKVISNVRRSLGSQVGLDDYNEFDIFLSLFLILKLVLQLKKNQPQNPIFRVRIEKEEKKFKKKNSNSISLIHHNVHSMNPNSV